MELFEITRTLIIEINRFKTKNKLGSTTIYIDEDVLSIFNSIPGKPIKNILQIDLQDPHHTELHFGSKNLTYVASYGSQRSTVSIPYGAIVGYELQGTVMTTPNVTGLSQSDMDTVYELLVEKTQEVKLSVQSKTTNNVIAFPREYKRVHDPIIKI